MINNQMKAGGPARSEGIKGRTTNWLEHQHLKYQLPFFPWIFLYILSHIFRILYNHHPPWDRES